MASEARDTKFQLMLSERELAEIDEYRWQNRIGSRAQAVRQLVADGIAREEKGPAVRQHPEP